jgi:chitinase
VLVMFDKTKLHILLISTMLLISCSGGGLDSDNASNDPLVLVNAGLNQTINEGVSYVLTGNASGQTDDMTYVWSVSPSLNIVQEDSNSPEASFVAPTISEAVTYSFTLRVTDGNGNQGSDTVQITINPINESPEAVIVVPQYEGFSNNLFPAGVEVILDGSGSFDNDAADSLTPIASFKWQQTAGVDALNAVSLNGDSLAFNTPITDKGTNLTFALEVTDQEGATAVKSVNIVVQSAAETQPLVSAGRDHQIYSGEFILLNGQASTSIPAAQPLTYLWLNDSELLPQIDTITSLQTYAIAPIVSSEQKVTFTLRVTDSNDNQAQDSLTVTIKPMPQSALNDSGVTQQANANSVSNTYQGDFPGQDGQRGQDAIAINGLLEKAGRGRAGFDFTRLDNIGDEVDDTTQPWTCVRDNHTGLIWEAKTTDSSIHNRLYSYSWYQSSDNGGYAGVLNGAATSCSITNCNTESYVAAVNGAGLCGFYDWRLPTHNELMSIVHFGNTTGPLIDTDYFPNTSKGLAAPVWYWSNMASVDGVQNSAAQNAWAIDFASGNDNFLNKSTAARIRLVRAGR